MPSQDVEALAELARLCRVARAGLPETGFYRLGVLLDMILVDLERGGFCVRAGAERATDPRSATQAALPQDFP